MSLPYIHGIFGRQWRWARWLIKNAVGAKESASAAEEMNAQAEHMRAFVKKLVAVARVAKMGPRKEVVTERS